MAGVCAPCLAKATAALDYAREVLATLPRGDQVHAAIELCSAECEAAAVELMRSDLAVVWARQVSR